MHACLFGLCEDNEDDVVRILCNISLTYVCKWSVFNCMVLCRGFCTICYIGASGAFLTACLCAEGVESSKTVGDGEVRIFVALFPYDPVTMSPNPDAAEEELPFIEGQIIKVRHHHTAQNPLESTFFSKVPTMYLIFFHILYRYFSK